MPIRLWCCSECNKPFLSYSRADQHENTHRNSTRRQGPEESPKSVNLVAASQTGKLAALGPLELTVRQLFAEMYQSRRGFSRAYFTNPYLQGRWPEVHPTARGILILRRIDAPSQILKGRSAARIKKSAGKSEDAQAPTPLAYRENQKTPIQLNAPPQVGPRIEDQGGARIPPQRSRTAATEVGTSPLAERSVAVARKIKNQ